MQLQKAAGKCHYGLKEFWSCCPVLRILEQTWLLSYSWCTELIPLKWQQSGTISVNSIETLQYSRVVSSKQINHMFKNRNLWGKCHRKQQPGPSSRRSCSLHVCRQKQRTIISLLTWAQKPDVGFTCKTQQLILLPSFTLHGTAWWSYLHCYLHCLFNILKVSRKLLSLIQDSLLLD